MWSFIAHVNGVTPMVGLDIYEHAFVFVTTQLSTPQNQQTFDIVPAAKNIYIITVSPLSSPIPTRSRLECVTRTTTNSRQQTSRGAGTPQTRRTPTPLHLPLLPITRGSKSCTGDRVRVRVRVRVGVRVRIQVKY